MSIERKDVEIRNQVHLMDAEGCHNDEPTEIEIKDLLIESGYNGTEIDIWKDDVQGLWRSNCIIEVI